MKSIAILFGVFLTTFTSAVNLNLYEHFNIIGKSLDKCCVTCSLPTMKYYYINDTEHTCSETCLTSKEYLVFKHSFPKLAADDKSTLPCERYNYHIVKGTMKKGKCPICTYFDVYDQDYQNVK